MTILSRVSTIKTQEFTSSGTFTVPTGVYTLIVNMCGGGGSRSFTYVTNFSGGGGGGYYENYRLAVSPGDVLTITVGAAGIANSTTAVSGGNSIIALGATTKLLASGGGGKTKISSSSTSAISGGFGGFPYGNAAGVFITSTGSAGEIGVSGYGNNVVPANTQFFTTTPSTRYQIGSCAGGITPFFKYGRGGVGGIDASSGVVILTWTE